MKKSIITILFFFIGVFNLYAQNLDTIFQDNYSKLLNFNYGWLYRIIENKDSDTDGIWFTSVDTNRCILHVDKDLNILHYANSTDGLNFYRRFKANNKIYSTLTNTSNGTEFYYKYIDLLCHDTLGNLLFTQRIKNEGDDTITWQGMTNIMLDNSDIVFALWGNPSYLLDEKPVRLIRVDTLGNVLRDKTFWKMVLEMDMIPFNNDYFLFSTARLYEEENNKVYLVNNNNLEIEDSICGRFAFNMKKINDSIVTFNSVEHRMLDYGYISYGYFYTYVYLMNTRAKYSYSVEEISNPLLDSIFYETGIGFQHNNIDFTNPDSIYSFFTINKKWYGISDQRLGTGIINFSSQGNLNYFFQTPINISPMGLKATSDGGLIIPYSESTGLYLYKFMPNGYNSILNIETQEKVDIKVYPNPAKDYISVDFDSKNFNQAEIELYDMQGRLVKKTKLKAQKGNRIDVSSLKAGNYSYNILLNGNSFGGMMIVVE
ncbi:MAG: T9SS type A sorting domain-containing protein [Bacteroidia bacterium]|nr:T9SS type A sorting domain-containing protein [Bacteroidia bacterium]